MVVKIRYVNSALSLVTKNTDLKLHFKKKKYSFILSVSNLAGSAYTDTDCRIFAHA